MIRHRSYRRYNESFDARKANKISDVVKFSHLDVYIKNIVDLAKDLKTLNEDELTEFGVKYRDALIFGLDEAIDQLDYIKREVNGIWKA